MTDLERPPTTAFVLGGGGKWGAVEIGMLAALVAADITPDVVLGCSIGAINGAAFANRPDRHGVQALEQFWTTSASAAVERIRFKDRAGSLIGRRPYLHDNSSLRQLANSVIGVSTFEELQVPFQCVAASIEEATEHWFDTGPLINAVMASCAIPVLFPPVDIGGTHYYDGGLVNSIPLDRAIQGGAKRIFVLQVGRIEEPLKPPTRLHEAGLVAFELARRQRFFTTQRLIPDDVTVHMLPSGHRLAMDDVRQLRWKRTADAATLIRGADTASRTYLTQLLGVQGIDSILTKTASF